MQFNQLLKLPCLRIIGDIEDSTLQDVAEKTPELLEKEEVAIIISSPGGSTDATRGIVEYLKLLNKNTKLYAVVMGICNSNAISLLCTVEPTRRYAAEGSMFLMHGLFNNDTLYADGTIQVRASVLDYYQQRIVMDKADQNWVNRTIESGITAPLDEIIDMIKAGKPFKTSKAKDLGLIAHVL